MAMKKCKECDQEISDKADKCPQCGAPQKKKTSAFTWLMLIIVVVVVFAVINSPTDTGSRPTASQENVDLGGTLYVHGNVVNLRETPSTSAPIVTKLHKGQKLIEIQTQGKWIEVGAEGTGGKTGWVYSSLVGKQFLGGSTKASANPKFEKFNAAFNELNASIKRQTGITFFTKAEDLGDGIVRVTATDTWLSGPKPDRQSNLRTIFQLWDAAEGSGLPIAVYVVDTYGNQQMSMKR